MTRRESIVKILISGDGDGKMVAEGRTIDVEVIFEKPFMIESLFSVLKEKIEERKASNGLSRNAVATRSEAPNTKTM